MSITLREYGFDREISEDSPAPQDKADKARFERENRTEVYIRMLDAALVRAREFRATGRWPEGRKWS